MRTSVVVFCLLALLGIPGDADANQPITPPGLAGLVKGSSGPLEAAKVYAYQITDLTLTRVTTGRDGRFLFGALPAGVYKVIAHKTGFRPAVVLLTRATRLAADFVELELTPQELTTDGAYDEGDFWTVRRQIPGDVLRAIRLAEAPEPAGESPPVASQARLEIETQMVAGLDRVDSIGESQLTSGRLGVHGRIGGIRLNLDGQFDSLRPDGESGSGSAVGAGRTNALALSLQNDARSSVRVSTVSHSLASDLLGPAAGPVDLERYRFQWSKSHSDRSRSNVAAFFMEESGFNTQAPLSPAGVPLASRTWNVNGSHSQEIGDRMTLRTGLSYQELVADALTRDIFFQSQRRINAFGLGSVQLRPGILVEYGLYSTVLDGSVSLSPHGGLLLQLGGDWEAETVVRHRLGQEDPTDRNRPPGFSLAYYRGIDGDIPAEEHFYKMGVKRRISEVESFSVGAVHREIGNTLRVFFSEEFFDQVESLYLVRGDRLPELQLALCRKLAPKILATLESTLGAGGGGVFRSSREGTFENRVRYLVTSLDTVFQQTDTGLFLAFHRVEQKLDPLTPGEYETTEVGMHRLQLKLTQELGLLMDLGTEWALLLNVELSRGGSPYSQNLDASELRKRVAGGIAVRF